MLNVCWILFWTVIVLHIGPACMILEDIRQKMMRRMGVTEEELTKKQRRSQARWYRDGSGSGFKKIKQQP